VAGGDGLLFHYFDACALAKRFTQEQGTDVVNELFFLAPKRQMACLIIGLLEVTSILVRHRNGMRLAMPLFKTAMASFKSEVIDDNDFRKLSAADVLLYSSADLIAKHNLNATDAVVLRTAIELQDMLRQAGDELILWTADARLIRAAEVENVRTFDPEAETILSLHQLLGITQ
jgi:predicted nucleic acid-binding protein